MSEKLRRGKERLLDGWDSLWEKLTSKIPRLPRPWRVARNLVCIPLAVWLLWLLMGGRALTPEWAFRREEQQQMVGPSESCWCVRSLETGHQDTAPAYMCGRSRRP